jgi:L-alanine-DL-glutamate epimerase-like enolase superfamily enzyme
VPPICLIRAETWPIRGSFRIARGAKREAAVLVVEIRDGDHLGRGECVPYARYGETLQSVQAEIEAQFSAIANGMGREALQLSMKAGAARNALDCALIDLEAKKKNIPAWRLLGLPEPRPFRTAFTLSLDAPALMAEAAAAAARRGHRLLKLKVAGAGDLERVEAVRRAAPNAELIVDANEGWTLPELEDFAPSLKSLGVALIEQPLPAKQDDDLQDFVSAVPLCADESCHTGADLPRIAARYDAVNVKLDKAGGLTEALALGLAAREIDLALMVGCMLSTSLAMAPALLLASLAAYVDLDGPLLLERDRDPGLKYDGDLVHPAPAALWG